MLVEKASNIEDTMITVYVRLLDEGTLVYRPVPATKEKNGVCILRGEDVYDSEVETWEFLPGCRVTYELQKLDGDMVYVATGEISN